MWMLNIPNNFTIAGQKTVPRKFTKHGKNVVFDKLELLSSGKEVVLSSGSPDLLVKSRIFRELEVERERHEMTKTPEDVKRMALFSRLEYMKAEEARLSERRQLASKPRVIHQFVVKDRFFDKLERLKTPELHYSKSKLFRKLQKCSGEDGEPLPSNTEPPGRVPLMPGMVWHSESGMQQPLGAHDMQQASQQTSPDFQVGETHSCTDSPQPVSPVEQDLAGAFLKELQVMVL